MNPKLITFVRHYFAGFLSAGWNGAIGAMAGIIGNDVVSISGVTQARIFNGHEMASVFAGAFVLHAVLWIKAHPLPENYDSSAPFYPPAKTPEIKDPPSKIPDAPTT